MTRKRDIAARAGCVIAAVIGALSLAYAGTSVTKSDFDGDPVSSVIFPPQVIPLTFSHVKHLTEADDDCESCHDTAAESRSSLDNLIPTEEACTMCHAIDRNDPERVVAAGEPPARCDACHPGIEPATGFVDRVRIPRPNLKFNHRRHVELGVDCTTCHGDLAAEGVELATRAQLPKMGLCVSCHEKNDAPTACTTCHLAEGGGVMMTEFDTGVLAPSGSLRGADHSMGFRTNHDMVAKNDDKFCGNCHRKEFCIECHNGTVKPMDFHGNDYITLHPIDARRNDPDCGACHRAQTFCTGCHSRSGVSSDKRGSEFDQTFPETQFHPPGWVQIGERTAEHHSYQAQRNIKQCAACHREQFCTGCHAADASHLIVQNPHPRGWIGSRRCESLLQRNKRMCLRCHIDAVEPTCDAPF